MRVKEIRKQFLDFFEARGHERVASSPVVPHDDPTLLFTNAGMNQFKSVFTGEEVRETPRACSSQKCIRAGGKHNDLENVGYTARHLTFFEMLGNFSFGDYFKKEACTWAWELITETFGIEADRLWISVFEDDDEAREIWRDHVGVSPDRIVGLGVKDNFWSMGDTGPCGPCSELHVDRGESRSCGPNCALGVCDCDRWMEIWNLVFMQFEQRSPGDRIILPKPSIDTGMGLERITMILQDKDDVYETDLMSRLIEGIGEETGVVPRKGSEGIPHRVIADHLRSLSFAIADGAFPSNEERGYVLRRILRRASRYGYKLGVERPFLYNLVPLLAEEMGDAFPELRSRQELIVKLIGKEEEQFLKTLKTGMTRFDEEVEQMGTSGSRLFPAGAAFFLHDSCGFPIDLTEQMAREVELDLDRGGFEDLMEQQRTRSRIGNKIGVAVKGEDLGMIEDLGATDFVGYHGGRAEAQLLSCTSEGDTGALVLDRTPFYAESGGQVGDTGLLEFEGQKIPVLDCQKNAAGTFVHSVDLSGIDVEALQRGVTIHAEVDLDRRLHIQRNHTATHLLHAALRQVVGDHVQQKGSQVSPERLRFDISHYEKVSPEQLAEVEGIVQGWILRDQEVVIHSDVPIDAAKDRGAMALFGEKYGDRVRMVEIGDFSVELCGGIHCNNTGEIGPMMITGEGSVSSGVRRIEALTGLEGGRRVREGEDLIQDLARILRSSREELGDRIASLIKENKDLKDGKGSAGPVRDLLADLDGGHGDRISAGEAEVVRACWKDAPQEQLLVVADALKRRQGARGFILASAGSDGVKFVVGTSESVPKGQVHCGKVAKLGSGILGGGGGGRPDMAQAGGKDLDKLDEALEAMASELVNALSGIAQ
ncbi:MAG: alanine--tRNA ligase [Planctomycetia bacterium]|jgi:alanyl-tRNA synthetase|nr:alanine--tRNA ligase [Planctomycetia bacterium]